MARDKVRYRGEPLACVAAVDVETAQKALDLIKFEYRELPAYFTSSDAMSDDAIDLHDHRPGNIEREVDYEIGDVDQPLKMPTWCSKKPITAQRFARFRQNHTRR